MESTIACVDWRILSISIYLLLLYSIYLYIYISIFYIMLEYCFTVRILPKWLTVNVLKMVPIIRRVRCGGAAAPTKIPRYSKYYSMAGKISYYRRDGFQRCSCRKQSYPGVQFNPNFKTCNNCRQSTRDRYLRKMIKILDSKEQKRRHEEESYLRSHVQRY